MSELTTFILIKLVFPLLINQFILYKTIDAGRRILLQCVQFQYDTYLHENTDTEKTYELFFTKIIMLYIDLNLKVY